MVEEIVEELVGEFVLGGLPGMGDVAGREDEIDGVAVGAIPVNGFDEGFENHVAVVGISGFDVEIGDVQPRNSHFIARRNARFIAAV